MKAFKKIAFFCLVGAAALGAAAIKRAMDEERLYAEECEAYNDAFYRNTCDCGKCCNENEEPAEGKDTAEATKDSDETV